MRVFISYAREDIDSAIRIYNFIRNMDGFDPWMDKYNLLPGMDWELEVMRAIEESHIVLLLLSKHSVTKTGFVQKEIREAIEKAKLYPPGRVMLIPVRLDECEPSHRELKKLQWVDVFPNWYAGKRQLLNTLRKLRYDLYPGTLTQLLDHLPRHQNEQKVSSRQEFLEAAEKSTNFSGYNLMYLDLTHLDLSGFCFIGANLVGAKLSGSTLKNTKFDWANLERANLDRAFLGGSQLLCTNLWRATMKRTKSVHKAIVENNNIFGLIGLSENQMTRLKRSGCFEADNYDLFFSYFKETLGLTLNTLAVNFEWLGHGYFRLLFSEQARIAFDHLSALFSHERETVFVADLADRRYVPSSRSKMNILVIEDRPGPLLMEGLHNALEVFNKKKKK